MTKKVKGGALMLAGLLVLVLSLVPTHLKEREIQKYVLETEQAARSLQPEELRDRYSPVATLLADNAYVTNIRTKSGSSRIYYAGLLRDQIREFFETHTLLENISVYLDDVPVIIDKNYILLDPAPEEMMSYIGYDPYFEDHPEVSLGRNCKLVLPENAIREIQTQNAHNIYLRFVFPRYVADPADAEVQFVIDYEQIVRQTLGSNYNQLMSLYLFNQENNKIYPLAINSEKFEANGLRIEDYLGKEWINLLEENIVHEEVGSLSHQGQRHRVNITPAGLGLLLVSLWDPVPADSPLQVLSYVIYGVAILSMLFILGMLLRISVQSKRKQARPSASSIELTGAIEIVEPLLDQQSAVVNDDVTVVNDDVAVDEATQEEADSNNDLRSYIDAHFTNPDLNAKLLAETFNYSEKHIYALWREQEDVSIGDYIQDLRLNAAYELIVSSNTSISDIAQNIGFSSYNTFYKAFRRKYDQTPSQIRQ